MNVDRTLEWRKTLERLGALPEDMDSLLTYNEPVFRAEQTSALQFPLPKEPFVACWQQYAAAVDREGSLKALFPYLTELLPAADLQPDPTAVVPHVTGEHLADARSGHVVVHPTLAGALPAIVAGSGHDFVVLVQALARRGVAVDLPPSMGALFLGNYKNKPRYRQWFADHPEAIPGTNVVPEEEYIERFAMLRPGSYSGIPAGELALSAGVWEDLSFSIRLEHECTHYFTRRAFGAARINVLDELLADFAALRRTVGHFNPDWERLFLGLEDDCCYRSGGRLENYLPRTLSDGARSCLVRLVRAAIGNLAAFDQLRPAPESSAEEEAATLTAVACSSLEELACEDAPETLLHSVSRWLTGRAVSEPHPERNVE